MQTPREKRKLSRRTLFATALILLLIPLTLYVGVFYLDNKKYYFISLMVLLECMAPFFLIFEGRKPKARELVIIAVLWRHRHCRTGRTLYAATVQASYCHDDNIRRGIRRGDRLFGGCHDHAGLQCDVLPGTMDALADVRCGHHRFFAGVLFRKGWRGCSRGRCASLGRCPPSSSTVGL